MFRFSWKMTVLKIRYTHEKRSCHDANHAVVTPQSRKQSCYASTLRRKSQSRRYATRQAIQAEPVLHVAKGAIGWSPFVQPLRPHQHWHTDISYLNLGGTFYYLCSFLDGASRAVVHWEIRESMTVIYQDHDPT